MVHTEFIRYHIDQHRIDAFIKYIRKYCKKCNIKLKFRSGASVYTDEGEQTDGFFNEPERGFAGQIVIAKGVSQKEWLITLGHEFAHVKQWIEDAGVYMDKDVYESEKDAERQSRKMMKDFGLPIDPGWHVNESKKYLRWLKTTLKK